MFFKKEDNEKLTKQVQALTDELTIVKNESASYKQTIEGFTSVKADHDAAIVKLNEASVAEIAALKLSHEKALTDLKAEYEKQISALSEQVKTVEQSTDAKAQAVLCTVGIPLGQVPASEPKTETSTSKFKFTVHKSQ